MFVGSYAQRAGEGCWNQLTGSLKGQLLMIFSFKSFFIEKLRYLVPFREGATNLVPQHKAVTEIFDVCDDPGSSKGLAVL